MLLPIVLGCFLAAYIVTFVATAKKESTSPTAPSSFTASIIKGGYFDHLKEAKREILDLCTKAFTQFGEGNAASKKRCRARLRGFVTEGLLRWCEDYLAKTLECLPRSLQYNML
jgi:hypothetical protein